MDGSIDRSIDQCIDRLIHPSIHQSILAKVMNRSSSTSAYCNILYRGGIDVVLLTGGGTPVTISSLQKRARQSCDTLAFHLSFQNFFEVYFFFLSSSRGNMSKSDATLAMASKAPEKEEENLGDRFVSENKEKELDGNAHTSIHPSIHRSNHPSIH